MNGPRTLSNEHLSYLVISTPVPSSETYSTDVVDYDLMMCAPHFIGDGTALHQSTHELLCLLTSTQTNEELRSELDKPQDWVCGRKYLWASGETDSRHRKARCLQPSKLGYPHSALRLEGRLPRLISCKLSGKRSCVWIMFVTFHNIDLINRVVIHFHVLNAVRSVHY
jgi:hypothetical protein